MKKVWSLWLIVVSLSVCTAFENILRTELVRTGDNVTLTCKTQSRWFFCMWRTPGGGKVCAINETGVYHSVCSGAKDYRLNGTDRVCSLHIPDVELSKAGTYICLLNQADTFQTERYHFQLNVAVPAEPELYINAGNTDPNRTDAYTSIRAGEITATKGQSISLRCRDSIGYPRPNLGWILPSQLAPRLNHTPQQDHEETAKLEAMFGPMDWDSFFFLPNPEFRLSADEADDGLIMSCVSWQIDGSSVVLYSRREQIKLHVVTPEPLLAYNMEFTGVVIIVSLLGVLLLVLVFMILFICYQKKKRKNRTDVSLTESGAESGDCLDKTNQLSPVWISKSSLARRMLSCSPKKYGVYLQNDTVYNERMNRQSLDTSELISNGKHLLTNGKGANVVCANSNSSCTQSTSTNSSFETERSGDEELDSAFHPSYMYTGYQSFDNYDDIDLRGTIREVKEFNPKGLGHFDPTVNVHDVTRPNSGEDANVVLNPRRENKDHIHFGVVTKYSIGSGVVVGRGLREVDHDATNEEPFSPAGQTDADMLTDSCSSSSRPVLIARPDHLDVKSGLSRHVCGKDESKTISVFDCQLGCFTPTEAVADQGRDEKDEPEDN